MAGVGKVVVVTGASRGIGYGIGKELATRMPGAAVYLTTRMRSLENLESNLQKEIGTAAENTKFRYMDLKDKKSINKFVDSVKRKHKRLDIMINNAAIYHKPPTYVWMSDDSHSLRVKEVEEIVKVNYHGLKQITEAFLPVMAEGSSIVNMSSHLSEIDSLNCGSDTTGVCSFVAGFNDPGLTMASLDKLMSAYIQSIQAGTWAAQGWPDCAYSVTKLAVNCYTRLLQNQLDQQKRGVAVNAICPGTQHSKMKQEERDTISINDAADIISYLATLGMDGVGDCSSGFNIRGRAMWHDMTDLEQRRRTKRAKAVAQ